MDFDVEDDECMGWGIYGELVTMPQAKTLGENRDGGRREMEST
jgi:hypothetical protein